MHYMFFSYTSEDWELDRPFLQAFLDDVTGLLWSRVNVAKDGIALTAQNAIFRDATGTTLGGDWPQTLGEALRTCRVFVYLRTSRYFESQYCAREFAIFRDRMAGKHGSPAIVSQDAPAQTPALILPVLWETPDDISAPASLDQFQYAHGTFGDEYGKIGLKRLLIRKTRSSTKYTKFLDEFVTAVVDATRYWKLNAAPTVSDILNYSTAWPLLNASIVPAVASPGSDNWGPDSAIFFYVYKSWDQGWFPYDPPPDHVSSFAHQSARSVGINPVHAVPDLKRTLVEQIKEACERNTIVVIVANPGAILDPALSPIFDQCNESVTYFNCALLFAWNRQVIGADDKVEKLRTAIRARFYSRIALTTTNVYLDSVESRDGLVDTIKDALAKAQARIMANPRFFRPAVAAPGLEPPVSGSFTISNML